MGKICVLGIVLFAVAGATLAQTAPATTPTAAPTALPAALAAATPVDAAKVSNAIKELNTAETQLAGVEVKLYADLEVVAGILSRCGFTVPTVASAPGTATYANERAAWADQIMSSCSDPAIITKVKSSLTDEDREALSNVKLDLIGLQAQTTPILTAVTGAVGILQNAFFGLPAMIAGGAGGGNVEELSKLLGQVTEILGKAVVLPGRISSTIEKINKLLGFINLVL